MQVIYDIKKYNIMKYLKLKNPQSFIDRRDALTVTFAYSAEAFNVTCLVTETDQVFSRPNKAIHI